MVEIARDPKLQGETSEFVRRMDESFFSATWYGLQQLIKKLRGEKTDAN